MFEKELQTYLKAASSALPCAEARAAFEGYVHCVAQDVCSATSKESFATVYKGNIIKNLIMDCQSYTKYRPNETTGGIFVSWRRKEELPTGA